MLRGRPPEIVNNYLKKKKRNDYTVFISILMDLKEM